MTTSAPNNAPQPAAEDTPEYCVRIRLLSTSGRLGRIRYIGFGVGFWLLFAALVAAIAALGNAPGGTELVGVLIIVLYLAVMGVTLLLTIQRCHDFNASGWLALLGLIPLGALVFCLIPGTDGDNRFGPKPPANSLGAILLAGVAPLVVVVGIIAAIALPTFQDGGARAQAASSAPR